MTREEKRIKIAQACGWTLRHDEERQSCALIDPKGAIEAQSCSPGAWYIAACAGPAEAGWRATLAVIDGLEEMDDESHIYRFIVTNILLAWEGQY